MSVRCLRCKKLTSGRKYCSDKCMHSSQNEKPRYHFICPQCDRAFAAHRRDRKFCSQRCSAIYLSGSTKGGGPKHHRSRLLNWRTCFYCGTDWLMPGPKRTSWRCVCVECKQHNAKRYRDAPARVEAHRVKARAYYVENTEKVLARESAKRWLGAIPSVLGPELTAIAVVFVETRKELRKVRKAAQIGG